MADTVDYEKLKPELREKIRGWEQKNPVNKQLRVLEDVATILQEMLLLLDQNKDSSKKTSDEYGRLLLDIREALVVLKEKEDPEAPDFTKPIVAILQKIEKSVANPAKQEIKPVVNVDAPQVHVEAPVVDVDLKGVEKVLKDNIPKAFDKAISQLPKQELPDLLPLVERLDDVLEQLASIDTATRMKPLPGSMKVMNADGSRVGSGGRLVSDSFDWVEYTNTSATVDTYTYRYGGELGDLVAIVTITYTDSTKEQIALVTKI